MRKSVKDCIRDGELFRLGDPELYEDMCNARNILYEFNARNALNVGRNEPMLKKLFKESGDVHILPPFNCEYGKNISFGNSCFVNFDCIFLDTAPINIGNHVLFGPRVTLITVGHPVDPDWRSEGDMYAFPINIEDNVWIGAGVIINPGVTIGKNTVIGSGSVVTKDIPSGVVAVGNPCRVLREINEEDKVRYFKDKRR